MTKNYGTLFCPDLGGKQFGGYWDSPNLYYFEIQVFFCENGAYYSSNNSKCTSLDTLRDFLNQDNPKLEEELDSNFTVVDDKFGEKIIIPLKPDGEKTMINNR